MRSNKPQTDTNIKKILEVQPRQVVLTAEGLLRFGLTRDQIRSSLRSGWIKSLGRGAYTLLGDTVDLDGALYALQGDLSLSVHRGGYSALSGTYGKAHNLAFSGKTELFASRGERVPAWFKARYGADFSLHPTSFLPQDAGLVQSGGLPFQVRVSSLERSILEMLYLTPEVHTVYETWQIMELLTSVKPSLLQELLEQCSLVNVKRLFLYLAETAGHSWFKRLSPSRLDLGSGVREIVKGGIWNRKYDIIIPDVSQL